MFKLEKRQAEETTKVLLVVKKTARDRSNISKKPRRNLVEVVPKKKQSVFSQCRVALSVGGGG